jgi:CheY-like chemotaxis protein
MQAMHNPNDIAAHASTDGAADVAADSATPSDADPSNDLRLPELKNAAEEDTVPSVHVDVPELMRWFDSAGDRNSTTAAPLDLTLRAVDGADALSAAAPFVDTASGLTESGPPLPPPVRSKEAHRAEVRRRRQASMPVSELASTAPPDVLVLDGDDQTREQLCALLEKFGFRAHPVQSAVQAAQMLIAKHFVAAFFELAFDGPEQAASIELCRQVTAKGAHSTGRVSALIVMASLAKPVERVRATLAGSDAFLTKPLTRGSVAQALEGCGVPLPADSRRA